MSEANHLQHTYKEIHLDEIDFQDESYKFTQEIKKDPDTKLVNSFTSLGIIHPPVLKKSKIVYLIVDGRKRLQSCRNDLKQDTCTCLILPEYLSEVETLRFLMKNILSERKPTIVEMALFYWKLCLLQEDEKASKNFYSTINIKPSIFYLNRLNKIITLEKGILTDIHAGSISEDIIDKLAMLSFRDRMTLHELIVELKLGKGKQKKLIDACTEIAKRKQINISDIFTDHELSDILAQSKGNPPQQVANLMSWLTKQKSPLLTKAERDFKKQVSTLNLPDNATLTHSKSFENDRVTLTITFSDHDIFLQRWPSIKKLL